MELTVQTIVYYGSFLVFPFLIGLWYWRTRCSWWLFGLLLILALWFIEMRFIEPQLLLVRQTAIDVGFEARVALIADTHLGAYKDERFLARVVEKINTLDVQYVLIAGDFTYEPQRPLTELFAPLADLQVPVYAVFGNHDVGQPGPALRSDLATALAEHRVTLMNNEVIILPEFTLIGLGSHMNGEDDVDHLESFSFDDNVVVLTHNPDTTSSYTTEVADLTLTGHTHCGQVRIPWLYKHVIPTVGDFDKGLTHEARTQLYITCGTGEIDLPLRFLNPPAIDVIILR